MKKKRKFSEVEKLKMLDEALGTGQVIKIKYHGGTNPGMVRDITPVYFNNNRPHLIDCYCTIAQDIRSFNIEKIEILEGNVQTDAHIPHIVSFTNMSSDTSEAMPQTFDKSMQKVIQCKKCHAAIAAGTKLCPTCGTNTSKPFYKKWWFWVIVIIILSWIFAGNEKEENGENVESEQIELLE